MTKFNSPFKPNKVKPTDTTKRTISGDYLDYNEYGKVEPKTGNEIDLMEISEAAKEGTELADQIMRMIKENTLAEAQLKQSDCADITNAPESVSIMLQQGAEAKRYAESTESKAIKEAYGISGKELASKTDEEINSILNKYIEKRINERKESKEDVKQ